MTFPNPPVPRRSFISQAPQVWVGRDGDQLISMPSLLTLEARRKRGQVQRDKQRQVEGRGGWVGCAAALPPFKVREGNRLWFSSEIKVAGARWPGGGSGPHRSPPQPQNPPGGKRRSARPSTRRERPLAWDSPAPGAAGPPATPTEDMKT